jgi:hypothetical protein
MNTPTPTETVSPSPSASEERLAQLTGFDPSSTQSVHYSPLSSASHPRSPLLGDEDLEEQITRHSFASSPLSKLVFVAGAVFLLVFIASLFLSQFQSPGESVSAKKPTETNADQQSPLLSTASKDQEKEELLSELALREQQERIKDLELQKAKKQQGNIKQPSNQRVIRTVAVRPAAVRQVIRPTPALRPVRYSPPLRPKAIASTPTTPTNPSQLWTQLAQVGSFGGGVAEAIASNPPRRLTPQSPGKPATNQNIVDNHPTTETPVSPVSPLKMPPSSFSQTIPLGQSVSAVLETAIAWEGSRGNRMTQTSDERYIVTLTEPLKNKFGNLKIPSGSQLVIRLEKGSNALVNLTAESLIINGTETPLPQGALKIRGVENQPLVAEMTTLGGNEGEENTQTLADVLSIAGDFADIPGSRSLSTLYRTLTGGNTRRSGPTLSATIFFLRKGISLEVFVNQTFSLETSESPLELNLSTLELPNSPIALELTNSIEEDGK